MGGELHQSGLCYRVSHKSLLCHTHTDTWLSHNYSLMDVFTFCAPLSAHSYNPHTLQTDFFSPVTRNSVETSDWLHDEIFLEPKSNLLCGQKVAVSPLFWCSELWCSETFCPLLSHHPVGEMKPGIICRTRGPHFPRSRVCSGFPVSISNVLLCMLKEITHCLLFFQTPLNFYQLGSSTLSEVPIYLKTAVMQSLF